MGTINTVGLTRRNISNVSLKDVTVDADVNVDMDMSSLLDLVHCSLAFSSVSLQPVAAAVVLAQTQLTRPKLSATLLMEVVTHHALSCLVRWAQHHHPSRSLKMPSCHILIFQ